MPVHPESQLSNSEDNANSDMGEIDLAIVDFKKKPPNYAVLTPSCANMPKKCSYSWMEIKSNRRI